MENEYIRLKDEWTIRGAAERWILFNFKKGLCEDRFSISENVYRILKLATGEFTVSQISTKIELDSAPYIDYLSELGVIEFFVKPDVKLRHFSDSYTGNNFLGRIMLHITGRCNLECKHCYLIGREWGKELEFDEIVNLIQQAVDLNVASFSITGGEPFVREDLFDILYELDRQEMKIEGIFTNATIVSETLLDKFAKLQEFPFFVSINGPFTKVHDGFVGAEGSFNQSLRTIRRLIDRDIKVFANTSLSVFIDDDKDIENFYELVKELKIYRWRVSSPFLEGNWKDNSLKFGISIRKELQIFLKLIRLWLKDGKPFDLELGHIFRYVGGEYAQMIYNESDYVCDYFRERIIILPDGNVGACPLLITSPHLVGNIRDLSLRKIWGSNKMRYYKDLKIQDIIKEECRSCAKLTKCGLGCRANSVLMGGQYEDIDSEICEISLSQLYDEFEEYLKEVGLINGG